MRKIKLNQLEMLIAITETGSFSAAAAELGCAQSRVSYAIGELERIVGKRLLHRSRSGCVPTDAGHVILAQARQMLRIADGMIPALYEKTEITGEVTISCFRSVGTHLLPYSLEALKREYPDIKVSINDSCVGSRDVNQTIENGCADIGISCLLENEQLVAKPFLHDSYVLVTPAAFRLHAPVRWADFKSIPFIQPYNPGASWLIEQYRAQGLAMITSGRLYSDTGILAMVSRGMGFSIFPRLSAFPVPDGVHTIELSIPSVHEYMLIAQPEKVRSKPVNIVMRFLTDKRVLQQTEAFRAGIVSFD